MHGMTEETLSGEAQASICPWCSATYTGERETCPSCGAALTADPNADPSLPGLTAIDTAAIVRAKTPSPRPRNRIMSWISGEYPDEGGGVPAEAGALAPPDLAVRREILRLELEAEVANLQAEADALLAEAKVEGREPGVSAEDAAASEAIVHEIERVSAGLDAVDEELGDTAAEAVEPAQPTPIAPPAPEAEAQLASDEAPPPA
ncbi:MAG: hypothetical protein K0S97_2372 [Chloroflexota bacterium]|jgi:hypothetical protein|nr:hypothetical protein [Chloroflexota bacterium]